MVVLRWLAVPAASAALVLLSAGCGSGGTSSQSPVGKASSASSASPAGDGSSAASSPAPVSSASPGHQSPEAAVTGYLAALFSGNASAVCGYIEPAGQSSCQQNATALPKFTGTYKIQGQLIVGTKALVELTGRACMSGSNCNQNSDPATGMPASSADFGRAYDAALKSSNSFSPVPCAAVNGEWYVAYSG